VSPADHERQLVWFDHDTTAVMLGFLPAGETRIVEPAAAVNLKFSLASSGRRWPAQSHDH
jgi:hypothetical protein